MKILSEGELKEHNRVVFVGGTKGLLGGLAASLPASYVAHRRWPYYRSLPLSIKALGVITVAVPAFVIAAEQAGHNFERSKWTGTGKEELDLAKSAEQRHWESLDTKGKVSEWATQNKWGLIIGSWGASMAGSFGIIMQNRYQTFPQKIVQARMWAQGLTLGVVIVSAVLSARSRKQTDIYHPHSAPDHSWADVIAIEERKAQKSNAEH